jgi:hypothetical protein
VSGLGAPVPLTLLSEAGALYVLAWTLTALALWSALLALFRRLRVPWAPLLAAMVSWLAAPILLSALPVVERAWSWMAAVFTLGPV